VLIRRLCAPRFSAVEILCALYRKECNGELKPGSARAALERFQADSKAGRLVMVPYGEDVIAAAAKIVQQAYLSAPPVMLRSLDAIHVASAMIVGSKTMVVTDARLRDVAMRARIRVLP
jgi:predicted nucleic acid-binding protein